MENPQLAERVRCSEAHNLEIVGLLPEFDATGHVREPSGSALPGITPSNAYRTCENEYVLIAGNGDSIFKRLMGVIGRDDLANHPAMAHNDGRSQHANEIDAAIEAWTQTRRANPAHTLDLTIALARPRRRIDADHDAHRLLRQSAAPRLQQRTAPQRALHIVDQIARESKQTCCPVKIRFHRLKKRLTSHICPYLTDWMRLKSNNIIIFRCAAQK